MIPEKFKIAHQAPIVSDVLTVPFSLDGGGREMVADILKTGKVRTMIDVGSFLCGSAIQWLEANSELELIGIDPWAGDWAALLERYKNNPVFDGCWNNIEDRDAAIQSLRANGPYKVAMANIQVHRSRFFPVVGKSPSLLHELAAAGVVPDLLYFDGDDLLGDLEAAFELFPAATLCGAAWRWGADLGYPVQTAVKGFCRIYGFEVEDKRATWVIHKPASSGLSTARTASASTQMSELKAALPKPNPLAGYLTKMGWFKSVEKQLPVDHDGKPLPWYTYSSIAFLEGRTRPGMRIFEYGSGNSTLWWAKRVQSVVSCENDESWFRKISAISPDNVDYRHCALEPGGEYCKMISRFDREFDIVIIDGRDRVNCARNSLCALKEDGIVIWDNSDREKYQEGYDFLLRNGFRRIDFWGLGPINSYQWCTSVFYRKDNCLGI